MVPGGFQSGPRRLPGWSQEAPRGVPGGVQEVSQRCLRRWSGEQEGDEGGQQERQPGCRSAEGRLLYSRRGQLDGPGAPEGRIARGGGGVPGWCTQPGLPCPVYTRVHYPALLYLLSVPCRYAVLYGRCAVGVHRPGSQECHSEPPTALRAGLPRLPIKAGPVAQGGLPCPEYLPCPRKPGLPCPEWSTLPFEHPRSTARLKTPHYSGPLSSLSDIQACLL